MDTVTIKSKKASQLLTSHHSCGVFIANIIQTVKPKSLRHATAVAKSQVPQAQSSSCFQGIVTPAPL